MPSPLCFVLMPFGQKPDSGGALVALGDVDLREIEADERQLEAEGVDSPALLAASAR